MSTFNGDNPVAPQRRLALITGAARRLGAVMARTLHGAGFDVAIHFHRSGPDASALAGELNANRADSAITLQQDLAETAAGERLIASLMNERKHLDVVVNNASVFESDRPGDDMLADWERMHTINVRTPYALSQAATVLLRESRGCIINITDIHGERPRPGFASYCASKAALLSLTRSLALELAPEVRVNAVSPGAILWADSESPEMQADTLRAVPMGRPGDPLDIAQAVLYLATASYVTGQVINVDGGRMLHG